MDTETLFEQFRSQFAEKRVNLSKEEIKIIAKKNSLKNKMHGMFTSSYYKRERLIEKGNLEFLYVFKERRFDEDGRNDFLVWTLHSPQEKNYGRVDLFRKVASNLSSMKPPTKKEKGLKRIFDAIHFPFAEHKTMEVPEPFSEGEVIFLSVLEVPSSNFPSFRLGFHPALSDSSLSDEILLIPSFCWPETFQKAHESGKLL